MPNSDRSAPLSRRDISGIILGAMLMACSCYGFWMLITHSSFADAGRKEGLIAEIGLASLPLVLLLFATRRLADASGHLTAAQTFQTRIDQLQKRLNSQDDFFRLVTDYTPSSLTVFDDKLQYWFVNARAADGLKTIDPDYLGKRPLTVLGKIQGVRLEKCLDEVRRTNAALEYINKGLDANGLPQYIKASYQPIDAFGEFSGGVMLREEDVTALLIEREMREDMLRQVIATLVAVVDRRDPYAAGHSSRVGKLSSALANELRLESIQIDAAEIAGTLMNFGKVLISRSILTKTESLTADELQRIRDGILSSADILSMIDFRAPVVPTLRQILERVDGAGAPEGLRGENILITARIVAVANAFVAMVSPRAYRSGIDPMSAVERLTQDSGTAFDGRVITALKDVLLKRGSKIDWLSPSKGFP